MFLLRHIFDLNRKPIIRITLAVQVIAFIVPVVFTVTGVGLMGTGMIFYPIMCVAFFVYWIVTLAHFSPASLHQAWKAARKQRLAMATTRR